MGEWVLIRECWYEAVEQGGGHLGITEDAGPLVILPASKGLHK